MRSTFWWRRVGNRGEMRRSKQHLDEWIDRLAAGDRESGDGDAVAAFIDRLGSDSAVGEPVNEALPGLLAAEARSVAENSPARTRSGSRTTPLLARSRTTQPLARKWRRRTMISTFLSTLLGKFAVATMAIAATGGGLAATDNLPEPVQQWVSDLGANIGIGIPAPGDVEMPDAPVLPEDLPEDASKTAGNVIGKVFGGDPTEEDFGDEVAGVASDGAADVSDTGDAGSQEDDYTGDAGSQADDYTGDAGSQADSSTDGAGSQADGDRP